MYHNFFIYSSVDRHLGCLHVLVMGICRMSQGTQTGVLYQPREVGWGGRFKREGTYVHVWLIDVEV